MIQKYKKIPSIDGETLDRTRLDAFGNTRIEDIEYDTPILAWVNNKWVPRFYKKRYCDHPECNNQIKAWYRVTKANEIHLSTISESKKSRYCSQQCANNARRKPTSIDPRNQKKKLSRPIQVTISDRDKVLENWLYGRAS